MNQPKPYIAKRLPKPETWREKSVVVPGQTLSIKEIEYRLRNNMPVNTTSRKINEVYRDLDLTDIDNMNKQFQDKVIKAKNALEETEKRNLAERKKQIEDFNAWKANVDIQLTNNDKP